MSSKLEPMIWSCDTGQRKPCFDRCQLIKTWMSNIKDMCCKLAWYWSHWHTRTYVVRTYGRWWRHGYKTKFSRIDGLPYFLNHGARRAQSSAIKHVMYNTILTHFPLRPAMISYVIGKRTMARNQATFEWREEISLPVTVLFTYIILCLKSLFYPRRVHFSGASTHFIRSRSTFLVYPSTGKVSLWNRWN